MPSHAPDRTTMQRWSFLVLFVFIAWLFWLVTEPLWVPISLGALVAIGLHPLHKKLLGKIKAKRRDAISAFIVTVSVVVITAGLAAFFCIIVLRQVVLMLHVFSERLKNETPSEMLGPRLTEMLTSWGESPVRLQTHVSALTQIVTAHMGDTFSRILSASAGMLLIVIFTAITSYYLLRHGERFTNWFVMAMPLPDTQVWELVRNFRDVARVMLLGTGVTAIYQGSVSFFGYWIAGVPHALVWSTLTGFASIVPAVGTTIIWAPISIWLLANNRFGMGIALFIYANVFVVFLADYVLRPRLLGSKVKMNDLIIFIALFGGIEAFGILGTILGPIIAALLMSMIHIYLRDYRPRGPSHEEAEEPPSHQAVNARRRPVAGE